MGTWVPHLGKGPRAGEAELDLPSRVLGDPQGLAGQESLGSSNDLGFFHTFDNSLSSCFWVFLGEWGAGLCVALLLLSFFFFSIQKRHLQCVLKSHEPLSPLWSAAGRSEKQMPEASW